MQNMIDRHGLRVAEPLARFLEEEALPGTGIDADAFWRGVADIFARLTPENRRLLAIRATSSSTFWGSIVNCPGSSAR